MYKYNGLSKVLVFATMLIAHSEYALSSALDQSEFEVVHYQLGSAGNVPILPFEVKGLSTAEPTHTWTDSKLASFKIPPFSENKRFSRIIFKDVVALVGGTYNQNVTIRINKKETQDIQFTAQSARQTIELALPHNLSRAAFIEFLLPNACRPSELNPTNSDPRTLALAFGAVDVIYEKARHSVLNMGTNKVQPLKLTHGFSDGEGGHRWLSGKNATLTLPLEYDGKRFSQITFDTAGLVSRDSNSLSQKLIVSGSGIQTREYVYNMNNASQKVTIDLPWSLKDQIELNFDMPNACLPGVLDPNNLDGRELSIAFLTADVSYFKPSIAWVHYGLKDYGQMADHVKIIRADKLHSVPQSSDSKVIVIDTGFDTNHTYLKNNLTVDIQNNYIPTDNNHGTHVSGIIKSIVPSVPLEVISTNAFNNDLARALRFVALSTGDVVNISLGFGQVHGESVMIRNDLIDAFKTVVQSGKVVMIAFGNDFNNHSKLQNYGQLYSKCLIEMVNSPRMMGRIRLVTNLSYETQNDERLCVSSNRAVVQCHYAISAPGTDIYSTLSNNNHGVYSGTSMAAPVMTGAYALLKNAIPGLKPEQYLDLLDRSARKYSRSGFKLDDAYGVGIVDVYAAYKLYHLEHP